MYHLAAKHGNAGGRAGLLFRPNSSAFFCDRDGTGIMERASCRVWCDTVRVRGCAPALEQQEVAPPSVHATHALTRAHNTKPGAHAQVQARRVLREDAGLKGPHAFALRCRDERRRDGSVSVINLKEARVTANFHAGPALRR